MLKKWLQATWARRVAAPAGAEGEATARSVLLVDYLTVKRLQEIHLLHGAIVQQQRDELCFFLKTHQFVVQWKAFLFFWLSIGTGFDHNVHTKMTVMRAP